MVITIPTSVSAKPANNNDTSSCGSLPNIPIGWKPQGQDGSYEAGLEQHEMDYAMCWLRLSEKHKRMQSKFKQELHTITNTTTSKTPPKTNEFVREMYKQALEAESLMVTAERSMKSMSKFIRSLATKADATRTEQNESESTVESRKTDEYDHKNKNEIPISNKRKKRRKLAANESQIDKTLIGERTETPKMMMDDVAEEFDTSLLWSHIPKSIIATTKPSTKVPSQSISTTTPVSLLKGKSTSAAKRGVQVDDGYEVFDGRADHLVAKAILAHRLIRTVRQYLVQWVGIAKPTWILKRMCPINASPMISAYCQAKKIRYEYRNRGGFEGSAKSKLTPTRSAGEGEERVDWLHSHQSEGTYIVNSIVTHRILHRRKEYLVNWDGYDASENTWERAMELRRQVPEIVRHYEQKLAKKHIQEKEDDTSSSLSGSFELEREEK